MEKRKLKVVEMKKSKGKWPTCELDQNSSEEGEQGPKRVAMAQGKNQERF
jgi:hypothetical protein